MNDIISKIYRIELDTKEYTAVTAKDLICKKNDSILFYITVKNDDEVVDLTGCSFSLVSARCDGVLLEHTIKEFIIEDGVLIFSPKKSFLNKPSTLLSELVISKNGSSITTQSFKFTVHDLLEGDCINGDEIKDNIDTLEELRAKLEEYNNNLKKIAYEIAKLKDDLDDINPDSFATKTFVLEEDAKIKEGVNEELELMKVKFNEIQEELNLIKDSTIVVDGDGIHTDIEVKI